jgi:hypothetical protein
LLSLCLQADSRWAFVAFAWNIVLDGTVFENFMKRMVL